MVTHVRLGNPREVFTSMESEQCFGVLTLASPVWYLVSLTLLLKSIQLLHLLSIPQYQALCWKYRDEQGRNHAFKHSHIIK